MTLYDGVAAIVKALGLVALACVVIVAAGAILGP